VFAQITRIVKGYLEQGGEQKLREMIEQEMAGSDRFDESELATVRQRQADIEAAIENLLDNLTATNRDYVDRRIAKLKDETAQLQSQEEALLEQQGRECQAAELVQAALALAPQVDQIARFGTVDEKRTFVRAFLRGIEFDPESRTGTAYFWAVPEASGGTAPDPGDGTRYEPATTDSGGDASGLTSAAESSLRLRNESARYAQKRTALGEDGSSLIMVAGAGFVPDSYSRSLPLVGARWLYAPAKQGAREMARIGLVEQGSVLPRRTRCSPGRIRGFEAPGRF
jgi:hypothetical protein